MITIRVVRTGGRRTRSVGLELPRPTAGDVAEAGTAAPISGVAAARHCRGYGEAGVGAVVVGMAIDAGVMPAVANEFAEGGVAAAIDAADGGAAAGAAATVAVCGTDCVEGRAGAAWATRDAFSGVVSCFQKAQRGSGLATGQRDDRENDEPEAVCS